MYLTGTTSSLNKILRPFSYIWYMFMGSPTDPKNLFPSSVEIEQWKETLANLPLMQDQEDLASSLEIRNTTVVTKLYLCKEKTIAKHEFLVADLRRIDDRRLHARIERNRGDNEKQEIERREAKKDLEDENSEPQGATSSSSVGLGSCSDICQLRSKAKDSVRFSPQKFSPSSVVKYYVFKEGHQPTMVTLAIAAFVAHEYDSIYSLFLRQCYWYADVICALLENIVGEDHYEAFFENENKEGILQTGDVYLGKREIQALRDVSGKARDERIQAIEPLRDDQWSKLRQGYNVVRISTRQDHVVKSLRREFDKVKKLFADKDAVGESQKQMHSQNVELQSENEELQRQVKDKDRLLEAKNKEIEELQARMAAQTLGSPSNQF